jgi:hypothetical protein
MLAHLVGYLAAWLLVEAGIALVRQGTSHQAWSLTRGRWTE